MGARMGLSYRPREQNRPFARCHGESVGQGGRGGGMIDQDDLLRVVKTALEEDLRYGPDATTAATVPADAVVEATISPRAFGTLAGLPAVLAVFDEVIGEYEKLSTMDDGAKIRPGDDVL